LSFRAAAGISPLSLLPTVVRGAPPSPVFTRTGEGSEAIRLSHAHDFSLLKLREISLPALCAGEGLRTAN